MEGSGEERGVKGREEGKTKEDKIKGQSQQMELHGFKSTSDSQP